MGMAEIVLRVRLIGGEQLDVTYEETGVSTDEMVERVIHTLADQNGVLRCTHGDRLIVLYGRGVGTVEVAPRGPVILGPSEPPRSELDQLGERGKDPNLPRREVHDHRGIALDEDDPAKAVLVVRHQVVQLVLLDGRSLGRRLEGTGRKMAPAPGAAAVHHYQCVPFRGLVPAAGAA